MATLGDFDGSLQSADVGDGNESGRVAPCEIIAVGAETDVAWLREFVVE
jgi:hypothetical protein